jgi:hypothetical protein
MESISQCLFDIHLILFYLTQKYIFIYILFFFEKSIVQC